jgi:hypothetical protein
MNIQRILIAAVLTIASLGVSTAKANTDEGTTGLFPWSGFWWQHKAGGLTNPLAKYDRLRGTQAVAWEQENHVNPASQDWFGHCHAWAASSVWEKEPQQPRLLNDVTFGIGDQKGLLAACHAQDLANSFGHRYAGPADNLQDIRPDELWRVLQLYVKQQRIPIILDMEAHEPVWNYPVYQYRIDYNLADDGWYDATLQLVAADDNVAADFVGTQPMLFTFTFRFQMNDGVVVPGTARWTGDSVEDHPDFAWYPYVAVAENPDIDAAEVSNIVGFTVGAEPRRPDAPSPTPLSSGPTPPTPPTPTAPPPTPPTPPSPPSPPAPAPPSIRHILSPDEFLAAVTNRTSSFDFDVFVDKGDGGRYRQNQPIRVSFQSGKAGYLYIFDIDPNGDVSLVFPLPGQQNHVQAGALYDFPAKAQSPSLFAKVAGQHDLKAIITAEPIQITGFRGLPQIGQDIEQKETASAPPAGQSPPAAAVPQRMIVYPAAQQRVRRRLLGFFRKGENAPNTAPTKIGPFAQDRCSYFVLPAAGGNAVPTPRQKQAP